MKKSRVLIRKVSAKELGRCPMFETCSSVLNETATRDFQEPWFKNRTTL